eukprot:TRINITY_DN67998_c0_g1_i1.p1 TRINITY_DN67998_c0_g1~~TRINITY_DN67998_c0_g1_i1.p1  ORF type:complete len:309 (-),score=98.17 TRINITY_DN67998_c0_g1_i1:75-1001(-)
MCSTDLQDKSKQAKHADQNKSETKSHQNSISSPILRSFLAGALSGTCSTILLQPLDLIKTRLQQSPNSRIWTEVKHVVKVEGFSGFWTGVTPSLWRTVPGIGLYFSCYHTLSSVVTSQGDRMSSMQSMMVGSLARMCAGTLLIPVTVVKTRWEAGGHQFQYKGTGMVGALRTIIAQEGVRGLVAGLVPTIARDAPYSGLYLMFYNNLKYLMTVESTKVEDNQLTNFMCGLLAGALATIIVQPADVVKTDLQLSKGRMGVMQVILDIYRKRGVGGFMVGVVPRVLRKSLMSALAWSVYEQATHRMLSKL